MAPRVDLERSRRRLVGGARGARMAQLLLGVGALAALIALAAGTSSVLALAGTSSAVVPIDDEYIVANGPNAGLQLTFNDGAVDQQKPGYTAHGHAEEGGPCGYLYFRGSINGHPAPHESPCWKLIAGKDASGLLSGMSLAISWEYDAIGSIEGGERAEGVSPLIERALRLVGGARKELGESPVSGALSSSQRERLEELLKRIQADDEEASKYREHHGGGAVAELRSALELKSRFVGDLPPALLTQPSEESPAPAPEQKKTTPAEKAAEIAFGALLNGEPDTFEDALEDYVLWQEIEEFFEGVQSDAVFAPRAPGLARAASTRSGAVPENGQIVKIEVRGHYVPGHCPVSPETVCEQNVHFQDLRPQPDGDLEVISTTQAFTLPSTPGTYTFDPTNFFVEKGDYIGLATAGGEFEVLASAAGAKTDVFVGHEKDNNGDQLTTTKTQTGQELNMRETLQPSS